MRCKYNFSTVLFLFLKKILGSFTRGKIMSNKTVTVIKFRLKVQDKQFFPHVNHLGLPLQEAQVGFIFKFKMLLSLSHSQKYQGSAGFLVRKVTQLPVHFSTGIIIYLFSFFLFKICPGLRA